MSTKKTGTVYDEGAIERHAGLQGIRKKPTPYIGPTDSDGLWTILREPADNAVDRALAGDNTVAHIIIDPEPNVYWIRDEGPGFPVGKKEFEDEMGKKQKLSTFFVATGLTHGGANFKGDTISRGTHGIGIKATNAMSKSFKVWTYRDKAWWCIEYKDAKLSKDVYKTTAPKMPHGIKPTKGSIIRFEPDLSLFAKGSKVRIDDVKNWCELSSYLVAGLSVMFTDSKGKTRTLKTKGPQAYIEKRVAELKCEVMGKHFVFSSKEYDVAIAFTNVEGEQVNAYTNGLLNKEGGEHLAAVYKALAKSLEPYARKSDKFTPTDVRDGALGLVNYKIAAPKFNNQPKDKLVDERVAPVAYPQMLEAWSEFWKKNKTMARDLVVRAALLRSKTDDFLKDKRLAKSVKGASKAATAKLADIQYSSKVPISERELIIVEGDSAGGNAKLARDKDRQAVFPIRGKILNVETASKDKIAANLDVSGMLAAAGVQPGTPDPLKTMKFGRLLFMADPDVDGSHINTLLITAWYKFGPRLFDEGRICVLVAPEYMTRFKGGVHFGETKEELYTRLKNRNLVIQHIKGWGELDPEDLKTAGLDPATRKLYRINPPRDAKAKKNFQLLMAEDSQYRKDMLGIKL